MKVGIISLGILLTSLGSGLAVQRECYTRAYIEHGEDSSKVIQLFDMEKPRRKR